jgi:tetratricopeptide (TPR) repeat protein
MLAKLFLALALTSAAPAALPQGGISAEGAQHMQAGVDAHKQGHFDVAAEEFRKATQTDPNFPQAYLDLGQVLLETRAYDQAVAALNRALELDPESAPAHLQLGFAFLAQGYADQAIPHLQKAKSVGALGIAFIAVGRYQEAIANLSAALAQRPGDPDVLYYLARASGLLSKQSSDQLMATHADSARAHQSMGENYYVLRQMPQAEKELDSAIKQRPDLPGLHLELGLVYAGSSQWPRAEEAFRAEATLQPGNAEAAYRLGTALLQEGKHHEARLELERADKLQPDMPETLYSLGKAASLEGESGQALAEKSWTRLLAIEKDSSLAAQAHFGLAALYRKQGKSVQAQQETQAFQKLQSTLSVPRVE